MARKTRDGFHRRSGSRFWQTSDPRIGGLVRSTKCEDIEAARVVKARWEREAADPARAAVDAETVGSCCDRLIEFREALGKATRFHEQKLAPWIRFLGEETRLETVGPPTFDEYVAHRRGGGLSDHTIGKEVGCFTRALKLSKRKGLYRGDLTVLRPLDLRSGYVPRTRALSAEELVALLGELDPARHAFVALLVALGVRHGELLGLRAEDFDLEAGLVIVRGTKTAGANRTIPVLAPFRRLIETSLGSVPVAPWGNYLRDLKAACARAKIADVTANDLRRTHATLLRSAGVDRDVVRRLLGHSPGSKVLETVYDQPKPAELAARAGDLTTLSRHLDTAAELSGRARSGSNRGPAAPEATGLGPKTRHSVYIATPGSAVFRYTRADDETHSQHSPSAHALALAMSSVLARGQA